MKCSPSLVRQDKPLVSSSFGSNELLAPCDYSGCDMDKLDNIQEPPFSRAGGDKHQTISPVRAPCKTDLLPSGSSNNSNNNGEAPDTGMCIQKTTASESLFNLMAYGSSSEDSDSDSAQSDAPESGSTGKDGAAGDYREAMSSDSDSSSSDDSSDEELDRGAKSKCIPQACKTSAPCPELDLEPPVPDLSKLDINVKQEECIHIGNVTSIVDRLVTIQSLPNIPAYDLDTLLFLDQGKKPLGHIYDVLGQVTSPMYVVRFNSKQEIEGKGISKGLPVYSAPNSSEHTQYVFLKQLMKIKGSDASWQGDHEVPPEFLDFSDDEAEYSFNKQSLNEQDLFDNKRKRNSVEKHKMFEVTMNLKNKVDTARHKMRDSYEPTPKRYMPQTSHPGFYFQPPPPNINQMRQQCSTSFSRFAQPSFPAPPPNFPGFMPMMGPFGSQFGMMPAFPPNPTFMGAPSVPPLPPMPQVMPQPFGGLHMPPPNASAMNIPKANIPKSPKSPQNGGVVPKPQHKKGPALPKLYIPPPADYQPYPPSLGLPKATVPPFATSAPPPPPPNIPASMPPSFGPPMPPWPYSMPRNPVSMGSFRPARSGSRQYKKQ